ncbi:UNVERIFIED_CONTAM: hypothetical protein PYX00_008292 [Menopon gallinae]|uniref:SH2 domain-containing protein n=1 Tax=Menopon gallinae TaxID=328185 RepID=A0AAW2HMR1_9NEOP
MYKSMRSRLEEYYIKGGRAGKKLDEMRTKHQRTCRKLHQTHNEYVLLLTEAVEFEKDYRTTLFPGLIESHQGVQESLVQNWKNSLEEAAKFSSLCTEQFRDLESRVIKIIEGIRPNQEYVAFAEKSRNPPSSISFTFDESLLQETPGRLQPNQLTVDNLTVDWLKSKLNDLDAKIKDEQERMLELGESILSNGKAQDSLNKLSPSPELARKRRELIEMRCDERKMARQFDLIKFALNDVGCEELPSGCDISIESAFTHLPESEGDGLDKKSEVIDGDLSKSRSPSSQALHKRSLSSHFNTLISQFRRKSIPSTPVLSHKERRTPERRGKSVEREEEPEVCEIMDDNDIISFSRVRSNTNKLYLWYNMNKNMISNLTKSLVDEEWFHGVLPREEVVRLLTREGDFLVRETTRNDECQTVLSVAWGGHKHFIVQTTPEVLPTTGYNLHVPNLFKNRRCSSRAISVSRDQLFQRFKS